MTTTDVKGGVITNQLFYNSSAEVVSESLVPQDGATHYIYSAGRLGMMVLREDAVHGRIWVAKAEKVTSTFY